MNRTRGPRSRRFARWAHIQFTRINDELIRVSSLASGAKSPEIGREDFLAAMHTADHVKEAQEAQVDAIRTIVRTIDECLGELLPTIVEEGQRDRLKAVAADLAADHLWMASPKLKHPSFEAEEEWRMIAYELRGPGAPHGPGPAGETHFRASAGRVVPFKQLSFETLPAFEVVLGSSCPMGPDDLGVLVLMEERLGARLTVRVSDVPVRT